MYVCLLHSSLVLGKWLRLFSVCASFSSVFRVFSGSTRLLLSMVLCGGVVFCMGVFVVVGVVGLVFVGLLLPGLLVCVLVG